MYLLTFEHALVKVIVQLRVPARTKRKTDATITVYVVFLNIYSTVPIHGMYHTRTHAVKMTFDKKKGKLFFAQAVPLLKLAKCTALRVINMKLCNGAYSS